MIPSLAASIDAVRPIWRRVRYADPLLMSAAISFNLLFAMVPLAIAGVMALSLTSSKGEVLGEAESTVRENLPAELADFLFDILREAQSVVGASQGATLVVAIVVAIYSGSRGIYTIQKALRLIDGLEEDRPYWVSRGIGIALTLAAGVALVAGSIIVTAGQILTNIVDTWLDLDLASLLTWLIPFLVTWTGIVLLLIYLFGPPQRVYRPLLSSVVAAVLAVVGTYVAWVVVPRLGSSVTGVLGSVGIVLLWFYYLGLIVILTPVMLEGIAALVGSLRRSARPTHTDPGDGAPAEGGHPGSEASSADAADVTSGD